MVSVENGATEVSAVKKNPILKVGTFTPDGSYTQLFYGTSFSLVSSININNDYGTTQITAVLKDIPLPLPFGPVNSTGASTKFFNAMGALPMKKYDNDDYGFTNNGGSQLIVPKNPVFITNYYKMRGFYTIGGVYETWIVIGTPSLIPPSGHTLTNTVIVASWSS